jgi:hypothetical protein
LAIFSRVIASEAKQHVIASEAKQSDAEHRIASSSASGGLLAMTDYGNNFLKTV